MYWHTIQSGSIWFEMHPNYQRLRCFLLLLSSLCYRKCHKNKTFVVCLNITLTLICWMSDFSILLQELVCSLAYTGYPFGLLTLVVFYWDRPDRFLPGSFRQLVNGMLWNEECALPFCIHYFFGHCSCHHGVIFWICLTI